MTVKDRVPQDAAPEPTWTYLRRVLNRHNGNGGGQNSLSHNPASVAVMTVKDRVPQDAAPEPTWTYLRRVLNSHNGNGGGQPGNALSKPQKNCIDPDTVTITLLVPASTAGAIAASAIFAIDITDSRYITGPACPVFTWILTMR